MVHERRTALITGANGGMGRACARRLGATMDLVLTDIAEQPLAAFVSELRGEGYTVAASEAGDLADAGLLVRMTQACAAGGGLGALVHTAGLSPAQADWRRIIRVNVIATDRLLSAIEAHLQPGTTAVLIASMAGHRDVRAGSAESLLDRTDDPELMDRMAELMAVVGDDARHTSGLAYVLSKRATIRRCEQKAAAWGRRGARIVSVSPGLIDTPMGRQEAETGEGDAVRQATPAGRWGTAMDIAAAVGFLVSEEAGFISGCDLRVDGGIVAATRDKSAVTARPGA